MLIRMLRIIGLPLYCRRYFRPNRRDTQTSGDIRQAALAWQLAVASLLVTSGYLVFFFLQDHYFFAQAIMANTAFLVLYTLTIAAVQTGRRKLASVVVAYATFAHITAAAMEFGEGAGFHLFYLVVGALSSSLFTHKRLLLHMGWFALVATCLAVLPLAFSDGLLTASTEMVALEGMYVVNAFLTVSLLGGFSYWLRWDSERSEGYHSQAEIELRALSQIDDLTGIPNRRALRAILWDGWQHAAEEGRPFAILMCDVDHFKAFNDYYGHVEGDGCLCRVAEALQASVRRPSDFVARYGGEEFMVVLPRTSRRGAQLVAERIRRNISDLNIGHAPTISRPFITVSIGVNVERPDGVTDVKEFVRSADKALYSAKNKGRNRVEMAEYSACAS